jgi:RNA polymerase sigma factor (TIGR02999 family)
MASLEQPLPDPLYTAVYGELKRLAHRQLRARSGGDTLSTTELVHEAFLKLGRTPDSNWESRAHFFGAASRAMRDILIDFARRKQATKRGGSWHAVSMSQAETALQVEVDDLLALDAALDQLDAVNQRLRQVVELRFFGGVPQDDIARMLGVSSRTVERDWLKARLFLLRAIDPLDV